MKQIHYDKMDPANPPDGVTLEICPNCKLPGKVRRGRRSITYIHTAQATGRGNFFARYYCKLSSDGRDLTVVIPVLPAKEEPCGST